MRRRRPRHRFTAPGRISVVPDRRFGSLALLSVKPLTVNSVKLVRPASEDEMILAFVQAEFDTERFQAARNFLEPLFSGDLRAIVDHPRLDDSEQTLARKVGLAIARGYPHGAIFTGLPADIEWIRVALTRDDLGSLSYLHQENPGWRHLSGGSLLVRDGAANVDRVEVGPVNSSIRAIEQELRNGRTYPEMIVVAEAPDARHVLFEGHTRATAYVRTLSDDDEVEVIAGYSPQISDWYFYPRG